MNCFVKFAAVSLLASVPVWCDQAKEPPKPPAKAPAAAAKVPAAKGQPGKGGVGVKNGLKGAPPVFRPVPNAQIQRFLRLTPQEREIAIDKMPVPNQEAIRKRLAVFDALPAEERERQLKLYDSVSKLPKDKQDLVNQRISEFYQLAPDRRLGIRQVYHLLSAKSEAEQRAIIDSPEFKERFTPAEQQIVVDLVKYYPNPQM
jgi:hypothetical protein